MNKTKFHFTDTSPRALRREFVGYDAHNAVIQNDIEALARAVSRVGVDVDHHHGHTPLTLAIVLARFDLVVWLMDNGADLHSLRVVNEKDTTPMHLAALCEDERVLQHLVAAQVSVSEADPWGYLPIHFAAQNRNERVLALLLDVASPNEKTNNDDTVAHIAAANENAAVIQLLIARHVNLLVFNKGWLTPLHIAARDNRNERVLAAQFAAVDLRDFLNFQPEAGSWCEANSLLHGAAQNKNEAVLALVLDHVGAGDINERDGHGHTPCFHAARNSNEKVIAMVLAAGADVHVPVAFDGHSSALCSAAARNNNDAVMAHLLAAGAAFHTSNISGIYPVHEAAENRNERVLAQLLAAGAEHFVVGSRGETICMAAAKNTNEAVLKLVLALPDIDLEARNARGETACQVAEAWGNLSAVRLLTGAGCTAVATAPAITLLWCADRESARSWLRRGASLRDVCRLAPDDVLPMLIAAGADVRAHEPREWSRMENDRLLTLLAAGGNVGECASVAARDWMYRQDKTALALMVAASAGEDQLAKYSQLISEPLLDWAIENFRLRQFDLLQLRAAEVCVGLQSLELPALVLCEIAASAFAPRECLVPFHKLWTIVTMVKHYHMIKN